MKPLLTSLRPRLNAVCTQIGLSGIERASWSAQARVYCQRVASRLVNPLE